MPQLSLRRLLAAAVTLSALTPLTIRASTMDPAIGLQAYRDFAENRGIFAGDATQVAIYTTSGQYVGTIERMMSFDSTADGGWSALTGGASFLATVAHNHATNLSFTSRFGAVAGDGIYDSYHIVAYNRAWGNGGSLDYDYATPRLNKIVTEAAAVPHLTDTAVLANITNTTVLRVGGGNQMFLSDSGVVSFVAGPYEFITGGTLDIYGVAIRMPETETLPESTATAWYGSQSVNPGVPGSYYNCYRFHDSTQAVSAASPLDNGIHAGDSGSPSWAWNPNTARWEFLASGQSSGDGGFGVDNAFRSGNQWAASVIEAYNSPTVTASATDGVIVWNTPDTAGAGTLTQGATSWSYVGLAGNLRGATSSLAADGVSAEAADDATMDATRNLVFAGSGANIIQLAGSIDMGAGSVTFHGDYTLTDGGVSTRRLNTAGFIIGGGSTVTSQLTGIAGDEWRVISDINVPGQAKFVVSGTGDNQADLNIGGQTLVDLDRTGGYAANHVKISGGAATVRLLGGANQVHGEIRFGHRGGTLDLYGSNFTDAAITHLDSGATLASRKANTTGTFTFTGSGAQTFLGRFTDGGSLATGLLDVAYSPDTPAGAVWTLTGRHDNKGAWAVNGGELKIEGTPTLHAGGYIDPNDWQRAAFHTGTVSVANAATFTVSHHADASSAVAVAAGGTFRLIQADTHAGAVHLAGPTATMSVDIAGATTVVSGTLSGSGLLQKTGDGLLRLLGDNSGFTGTATVSGGTVHGSSATAVGAGSWTLATTAVLALDNTAFAAVKAHITTGSSGTFALSQPGATRPDDNPVLTGYANLSLGARGTVQVGAAGTAATLAGWTADGGWNLGGGGGNLVMNLKLTGTGQLNLGNGANTGTVTLANIGNTFTGDIILKTGVDLAYTDIRALGGASMEVGYGSALALGSGADAATAFGRVKTTSAGILQISGSDTNAYDFANGPTAAALGASGTATYSGTLTPDAARYRFGGAGDLTVASALTGANGILVDAQGKTGGVVTLTGANTFTGTVTVQGKDAAQTTTPLGAGTLRLGGASALGGATALDLRAGGALDLHGYDATFTAVAGASGSRLTNLGASASTLTLNLANDTALATDLIANPGRLNLVKSGSGILTLAGINTGSVTVNAGTVRLGHTLALASGSVRVNSGGAFDTAGLSPANRVDVTLAGTGAGGYAALHNSATDSRSYLGALTLAADASVGGASSTAGIDVSEIRLDGHTLTLGTVWLNAGSSVRIHSGNIVANDGARIYMQGGDYNLGGSGTITLNSGAEIGTRDFDNRSHAELHTIALNGGTLSNGGAMNPGGDGDGGGATSTLGNTVRVDAGGGTLSGNNWWFGNGFTLGGALTGSGALRVDGAVGVRLTGDTSGYTGTITLASGLGFDGGTNQVFNGILTGAGNLSKQGANTTALTGANTHTGNTDVYGGILQIGNGGTTGSLGAATAITVHDGGTLAFKRSNTYTFANAVSGAGGLTQLGSGVTILSGASTYTGATRVEAGTLRVTGSLGNTAVSVASGATLTGSGSIAGDVTVANGGILRNTQGATLTTGNLVLSSGSLVEANFTAANGTALFAVNGNLTLDGALALDSAPAQTGLYRLFSYTGALTDNGLTTNSADLTVTTAVAGQVNISNTGSALVFWDGAGTTANNAVNGGAGTWSATRTNWTNANGSANGVMSPAPAMGILTGTAGTVTVSNTNGQVSATGLQFAVTGYTVAGAALQLVNDTATGVATLRVGDGTSAGGAMTGTISAVLSGTANLRKTDLGTLVLSGVNTYSGSTLIQSGTLRIGGAGQLGAGNYAGDITNLGVFQVATSANQTLAGVISGTGNLVKSGTGTLTLSGVNTYTGATSVTGGTLVIAADSALGAAPAATTPDHLTLSGATLRVTAVTTLHANRGVTLAGSGATIDSTALTASDTLVVAGAIKGAGPLTLRATGDTSDTGGGNGGRGIDLTGRNSFTGDITVTAGLVSYASDAAFGAASNKIILNGGGLLDAGGSRELAHAVQIGSGGATLRLYSSSYATWTGAFSGTGVVNRTDGGALILAGDVSGFTGTFNTRAGNTVLSRAGTVGGQWTVASGSTLGFASGGAQSVAGTVSGDGSLTKWGAGTLTLTGTNTYTGGTTVSGGTLLAGAAGAFGSGAVTVNAGGTLNTGLAGTSWTHANAITVNTGGTLMGAATHIGAVTINSGGTLAPGNSPGVASFSGGLSFTSGAAYAWEFSGNNLAVAGTDFDQLLITGGTMSIGSGALLKFTALGVDYTNAFWDTGRTFLIADAQGAGLTTGTFTADTSAAGAFATEGSWSLSYAGGDVSAVWTAIPEPSEYGLMGAGALAGAALLRRRRKRN